MAGSGVQDNGGWVPAFPGQRSPFERGNLAAARRGAHSKKLTGPLAEAIAAEQLARDDCPLYIREPSDAAAVQAWAQAEAECVKLRERDQLEAMAGDDTVDVMLTDVIETSENESRPAPGALSRTAVMRQRESLAKALHRAEMRARSLRNDLGLSPASRARLGKDIGAQRWDLALWWAAEDGRERAGKPSLPLN